VGLCGAVGVRLLFQPGSPANEAEHDSPKASLGSSDPMDLNCGVFFPFCHNASSPYPAAGNASSIKIEWTGRQVPTTSIE
jgi:hypothetical protein